MKESQKELIRSITKLKRYKVCVGHSGCTYAEKEAKGGYVIHSDLEELTDKLKQEFPEAFETKLEIGKWYVYVSYPKHIFYVKEVNSLYFYYGFNASGVWRDNDCYSVSELDNVREATKEEVKEVLIKEAKRRGIWDIPVKCLDTKIDLGYCPAIENDFNMRFNRLMSQRGIVFKHGKWAEPIHKELTVAQIEKELGYKVKIVKE